MGTNQNLSSIGDITKKIIEIERSLDLFDWEIENVRIWEVIRYKIYQSSIGACFSEPPSVSTSIISRFSKLLDKTFDKLSKYIFTLPLQPFSDKKQSNVLVFESSRKLIFNNEYIDPYTKFTVDELLSAGQSITKYQSSYTYDKLSKPDKNTRHLEALYLLSEFRAWIYGFKLRLEDKEKINQLELRVKSDLGIVFSLSSLIEKEIKLFIVQKKLFNTILKEKRPKQIFIVNFCDRTPLIAAAKELRTEVIDIQHGLISSQDIIYHYPNTAKGSLKYFPDKFYVWSEVWKHASDIPLEKTDIIVYGNKYLENKVLNYSHVKKQNDLVLIVSQPGLTKLVLQETVKKIDSFKGKQVVFKFHPSEYAIGDRFEEYKILKEKHAVNFVVRDVDLYELFAKTPEIVGVSSTALIEALSFNCKVKLYNLPSVEWMAPFRTSGKVSFL